VNPRYRVIWKRSLAENRLAAIVARAMARGESVNAISRATAAIDRILASGPESAGESRNEFERVLFVPPLNVTFEIHEEESVVYVLRLRYRPRRAGGR
jgi:hypothetical protein